MQKKLIALAVAGLASTGAFAQSSVTVYGVADAYVAKVSAGDNKVAPAVNSGGLASSRIGFKGVEDLGNGLKALFVLEYGLTLDQDQGSTGSKDAAGNAIKSGSAVGTARQQMVGLTGGFGTAVAGRLQTTGYDWAVKYDVLAGTAISALQNVAVAASSGTLPASLAGAPASLVRSNAVIGATTVGARANNALAYISPSFGGVTVAVNYARDLLDNEGLNSGAANHATLASATWSGGPASVGLVVSRVGFNGNYAAAPTVAGLADAQVKDWALGGSYDFGVAKLTATYQSSKANGAEGNRLYSLGAAVPVTAAGTVVASYAHLKDKDADKLGSDENAKSYTVAYLHGLSKRTTAYAGYTRTSNGDNTNVFGVAGVNASANGGSANALVAGLNHKF